MTDQYKFEKLVKMLAELSDDHKYDDEIYLFADKVGAICEASGLESPCFGIARSQWSCIDFYPNVRMYSNPGLIKFHAEYYDGNQAPFIVCEWNDDLEKLEMLLKETSETLYEMYQDRLNRKGAYL